MENTSYALQIAGAVLIAVMVIALVVLVFNTLSTYQESKDDAVLRENIKEFNQAFEAYDKKLMYGTDVLSCLNKAENNNQKYVYNIYYGTDTSEITYKAREEYLINVQVDLKTDVQEKITVNCRQEDENGDIRLMQSTDEYNFKPFSNPNGFELPNVTFYYFKAGGSSGSEIVQNTGNYADFMWSRGSDTLTLNSKLKAGKYGTTMIAGTYNLVGNTAADALEVGRLAALLSTVTNSEQIIYKDNYTGAGWYSATWTAAVYDFKSKKFKCLEMKYNEDTGYVNFIHFEEID